MEQQELELFLGKRVSLCFKDTPSILYCGFLEKEKTDSEKQYFRLHWDGVRPFTADRVKSVYTI